MVTAATDGKLPLCEQCFTCHVGQCTIKCHKYGKVGHKARYCKEKSVAKGANTQPIWTCYDYGEQGHTRNRSSKKVNQEEVREARGQAYDIKDAEPQGLNVVTGTRSMPIELGTFDVIIGMDRLVKHDAVIVCGEKVVHIPYGNEMLLVESDNGVSRLKVVSCIKARKYVERGCYLFLTYVTESKSNEKRIKDVPIIHDFPEVFPEELLGLPQLRQVEFRIDLVSGATEPVARAPYRLAPSEMKELSTLNVLFCILNLSYLMKAKSCLKFHERTTCVDFKNVAPSVDPLGKFNGKADEGFFVRYSVNSKAFRVFNSKTMTVEEPLHITFLENKPNVAGTRLTWLFDIDTLTKSLTISQLLQRINLMVVQDSPSDRFKPSGEEEKKDAEDPWNKDNEVLSTKEPRVIITPAPNDIGLRSEN
nr:reverse transcriptase domain-containing protein [Tanacetum cinerariifolium]